MMKNYILFAIICRNVFKYSYKIIIEFSIGDKCMENFCYKLKDDYYKDYSKKILLADDNYMNIAITTEILALKNYDVDVAKNGIEVLKIIKRIKYDVILMDVQMPFLDGVETTKMIRRLEQENKLGHVPIIAFTAHALEGDRERFLSVGMDGYISKPFEIQNLYNVIEETVKEQISII